MSSMRLRNPHSGYDIDDNYSMKTQGAERETAGGYHSLLACHEVSRVSLYIRARVCCQKVVLVNGRNQ